MLHIYEGGTFRPATHQDQSHRMHAFGAIGMSLGRLAARHGIIPRADGISIETRASNAERWKARWSDLQTDLIEQGAERALIDLRRHRADAFSATSSAFGAQDLVANYGRIFEEKMPPLVYRSSFDVGHEIPVGAESYRVKVISSSGEAQIYRGSSTTALVDINTAEELRPVHTYVAAFEMNWLMSANGAFAGLDLNGRLLAAAKNAIERVYDELSFVGGDDVWGLKNYPALARYESSITLASMTADNLKDFLITVVRRPAENSKTAIRPTVLEVSPEIMTKAQSLTISGNGQSVAQWFQQQPNGQGGTYRLVENWRMTDFGGSGKHGCFARGESGDSTLMVEAMPPLVVPGAASPWSMTTYVVGQFGGALNPYPVGMEIGLVTAG